MNAHEMTDTPKLPPHNRRTGQERRTEERRSGEDRRKRKKFVLFNRRKKERRNSDDRREAIDRRLFDTMGSSFGNSFEPATNVTAAPLPPQAETSPTSLTDAPADVPQETTEDHLEKEPICDHATHHPVAHFVTHNEHHYIAVSGAIDAAEDGAPHVTLDDDSHALSITSGTHHITLQKDAYLHEERTLPLAIDSDITLSINPHIPLTITIGTANWLERHQTGDTSPQPLANHKQGGTFTIILDASNLTSAPTRSADNRINFEQLSVHFQSRHKIILRDKEGNDFRLYGPTAQENLTRFAQQFAQL